MESRLTQLREGTPGLAWWRDRAVRRKSTSGASATGLVSRRATSAPSHRADEPPGPQAPEKQARLVHTDRTDRSGRGARMRCPGASVLCLSAPLIRSGQSHPGFYTQLRTSAVAVEEPPSSRDPTTRSQRRSPRHSWLSLRRRCMSSCGAETHLLFSGHSTSDASDTAQARKPRLEAGVHVGQPAPKAASKVSHEARRSSEEYAGSARPHRPNYESPRFAMVRKISLSFCLLVLVILASHFRARMDPPGGKAPLGIRLESTRPS